MVSNEAELLEYACQRFEEGKYDEALEAFVLAYSKGIEQEWILENIYNCYMAGNEAEFRRTYEQCQKKTGISYEDCILEYIPYKEGEYYIFDTAKKQFLGKISVENIECVEREAIFKKNEFSAAVVFMDWNWKKMQSVIVEAKERKIYVICQDLKRCSSYYKIPELAEYFRNVQLFSSLGEFRDYFHMHTAEYLPKIFIGDKVNVENVTDIINEEHLYRLTPEGRNTENVLLTIGIPTHDRGNLLLQRLENLQKLPYDAEIEIAISKNGTHYYQEEYNSVKKIPDARINYVGYDKEITMSQNWCNVIKIACGKFVLLVSDEDDVIIHALEHYMKLLSSHENLGMVRPRTEFQYRSLEKSQYFQKGEDAFLGGFLMQNYLSGAIYNRRLFLELNIDEWNQKYEYNTFYRPYPHMWWQVLLAFKGDYATDTVCLIKEGDSVLLEESLKYRADGAKEEGLADGGTDEEYPNITTVSTYSARVEQFQGGILLINDFEEFDEELRANALLALINKNLYLMEMVRDGYHYKVEEFPKWVEKLVEQAMRAMDEMVINRQYKKQILEIMLNYVKGIESDIGNV